MFQEKTKIPPNTPFVSAPTVTMDFSLPHPSAVEVSP